MRPARYRSDYSRQHKNRRLRGGGSVDPAGVGSSATKPSVVYLIHRCYAVQGTVDHFEVLMMTSFANILLVFDESENGTRETPTARAKERLRQFQLPHSGGSYRSVVPTERSTRG